MHWADSSRFAPPLIAAVTAAGVFAAVLVLTSWPAAAQAPGSGNQPSTEPSNPAVQAAPDEQGPAHETWRARFQSTYVRQHKPSFRAPYSGPNSLIPEQERSHSLTATAMFGVRPWGGAEVYFNPEMALGLPLSSLTGLGGFPNAELARTSGRDPTFYVARGFIRQTVGLGGGTDRVVPDQNRAFALAGEPGKLRLLAYRNRAVMGAFSDALTLAAAAGGEPAVSAVRRDQTKVGFGINLEQRLGRLGGLFFRAARHDGRTET